MSAFNYRRYKRGREFAPPKPLATTPQLGVEAVMREVASLIRTQKQRGYKPGWVYHRVSEWKFITNQHDRSLAWLDARWLARWAQAGAAGNETSERMINALNQKAEKFNKRHAGTVAEVATWQRGS